MVIKHIELKDIPEEIISEGRASHLIFSNKFNAHYFGGFLRDRIMCLTCLIINKNKTGSIKSNFTSKEYRGQGYFTELNKYCLKYAREHGVKRILLNCLKDSVSIHQRQGARIWKTTKTIYWMIYDEGSF